MCVPGRSPFDAPVAAPLTSREDICVCVARVGAFSTAIVQLPCAQAAMKRWCSESLRGSVRMTAAMGEGKLRMARGLEFVVGCGRNIVGIEGPFNARDVAIAEDKFIEEGMRLLRSRTSSATLRTAVGVAKRVVKVRLMETENKPYSERTL